MRIEGVLQATRWQRGGECWWVHPATGCPVAAPELQRGGAACAIRQKATPLPRQDRPSPLALVFRRSGPLARRVEPPTAPEQPQSPIALFGRQRIAIPGEPG